MKSGIVITITLASLLSSINVSGASGTETFNGQTPLNVLQAAATNGNPVAECILAKRLILGQDRSPAMQRLLVDAGRELSELWNRGWVAGREYISGDDDMFLGNDMLPIPPDIAQRNILRDAPEVRAWKTNYMEKREVFIKLKTSIEADEAKQAVDLFEASIAKGNVDSMVDLAFLCSQGSRVTKNLERSFKLNKQAAELGSTDAMCQLGVDYAKGEGVTKDMNEAMKWLNASFEKGSYKAALAMAEILLDGGVNGQDNGYPKDPERAYALGRGLQLASQEGSTAFAWGTQILNNARQRLDPDQLITAENEAETISRQLSSPKIRTASPTVDLKNHATMTKDQWKAKLGQA
jgi:hypothetical protein